ncbi:S1/P1 nuclease [Spirosoma oryzicola]|uniref:S1/P1 nuclease n=1 Tax=Spirosoma oryzicola TaxID=2898794 RepID=UPI001E409BDB|nr:S1/P1 nuclease [Spirosoma oryzicola]UHG91100.1 S1/P1 nuclease [Spirosoma oryzicola]
MKRLFQSILVFIGLVFITLPAALGWNKATHMAIGAMAYQELNTTSPQLLPKLLTILKQHPYFQNRWAPQMAALKLSQQEQDEYLFMLAARWPDDVKGTDPYHDHFSWHFINYVYAPQQGIARSDSALPTGETILQAYALNRQLLKSNVADSSKAIALCWLFHLTGDVHMPLHTSALVGTQFPQGDKGGNLFKIKLALSSNTTNLHSFWDGMLLNSDDYHSADSLATQERAAFSRTQLPQLGNLDLIDWSKESFQLAQDNVYRNNTLQAGSETEGSVLPPDYIATVKPIARRQVALAGYRLADELVADLSN